MKYSCSVVINLPRDKVINKFDSTENLSKWQPTLKSFEVVQGEPGKSGLVSRMVYDNNGRRMEMTETITDYNLPDSMDATYTAKGVINPCHNVFEDLGDGTTRWTMETEFRFSGFMSVLSVFMKKAFPRETQKSMDAFKAFAETE